VTASTIESLASTRQQRTVTGDESDKEDLDGGALTEGENDDLVIVDLPPTTSPAAGRGSDPTTPKKKTRRGKRGAKKPRNGSGDPPVLNNVKVNGSGKDVGVDVVEEEGMKLPKTPSSLILASTPKAVSTPGPSLVVSDTVLGKLLFLSYPVSFTNNAMEVTAPTEPLYTKDHFKVVQ
jgi:serine/threonine-protein kinase/endoribonuclease IRE1